MTEDERNARAFCNHVIERGAELMAETGAPLEMIIDRFFSYALAQVLSLEGAARTARILRRLAKDIEAGRFDQAASLRSRH